MAEVYPPLSSLDALARQARDEGKRLVPVYQEVMADLETPLSAYMKLARAGGPSFLLESVQGAENLARFSLIGSNPYKVIKVDCKEEDPLVIVEEEINKNQCLRLPELPFFTGGAVGYIGFDAVQLYEPRTAENKLEDVLKVPDSIFIFCHNFMVFDHLRRTVKLVCTCEVDGDLSAAYEKSSAVLNDMATLLQTPFDSHLPTYLPVFNVTRQEAAAECRKMPSNHGKESYEGFVRTLKEEITKGSCIQVVPSHRLTRKTEARPLDIYRQIRIVNPSPYMFYLDFGDFQVIGASPEICVRVEKGVISNHPLAGTRGRGATHEEDEALAKDLLADEKERAEHIMLVDLGRNDVGRVAKPGSVVVSDLMHIERYSHVMHIVSNVTGQLADDKTIFDAFRSIFPAGTLSGAPKVRAMGLIGQLEKEKRGLFGGAVGHVSFAGDMDTCIAIRTMVYKDNTVYLQAGAGIVYDSDPCAEYEETIAKMGAPMRAVMMAEKLHEWSLTAEGQEVTTPKPSTSVSQKRQPSKPTASKSKNSSTTPSESPSTTPATRRSKRRLS